MFNIVKEVGAEPTTIKSVLQKHFQFQKSTQYQGFEDKSTTYLKGQYMNSKTTKTNGKEFQMEV